MTTCIILTDLDAILVNFTFLNGISWKQFCIALAIGILNYYAFVFIKFYQYELSNYLKKKKPDKEPLKPSKISHDLIGKSQSNTSEQNQTPALTQTNTNQTKKGISSPDYQSNKHQISETEEVNIDMVSKRENIEEKNNTKYFSEKFENTKNGSNFVSVDAQQPNDQADQLPFDIDETSIIDDISNLSFELSDIPLEIVEGVEFELPNTIDQVQLLSIIQESTADGSININELLSRIQNKDFDQINQDSTLEVKHQEGTNTSSDELVSNHLNITGYDIELKNQQIFDTISQEQSENKVDNKLVDSSLNELVGCLESEVEESGTALVEEEKDPWSDINISELAAKISHVEIKD
ncbi:hypothetical protein QNI19_31950 [Cytophagaceae bacterium DM2B3-1]|uniref:Transmembrane protein n=1 Tax=Xanthocytophaga flava TaxID=3048013 RepID=A0ABT7CUZ5_9BACT|nr:hypothetical protein [Xanthocytophaga flavus]MDJ1497596.1 hypothetical protein [Xanthocytophaga flavus]